MQFPRPCFPHIPLDDCDLLVQPGARHFKAPHPPPCFLHVPSCLARKVQPFAEHTFFFLLFGRPLPVWDALPVVLLVLIVGGVARSYALCVLLLPVGAGVLLLLLLLLLLPDIGPNESNDAAASTSLPAARLLPGGFSAFAFFSPPPPLLFSSSVMNTI